MRLAGVLLLQGFDWEEFQAGETIYTMSPSKSTCLEVVYG